jgi:hypothetical protein
MCVFSADNRVSIAPLGGVNAVLDCLRRHAPSAAVAEVACGALGNLALNGARVASSRGGPSSSSLASGGASCEQIEASNDRLRRPRTSSTGGATFDSVTSSPASSSRSRWVSCARRAGHLVGGTGAPAHARKAAPASCP